MLELWMTDSFITLKVHKSNFTTFLKNWDSLHARLNSDNEAWSCNKKIKA